MDRKEYMREYMAKKRANTVVNKEREIVNKTPEVVNNSATRKLAEKLVDPGWRSLLEYLATNLRHDYADDIRLGCFGPTLSELKPLLSVVP